MIKLIIDTNRIMAALIRNGPSRALLFSKNFQFFTPYHALIEIAKHSEELCEKAHINSDEFELLIDTLFEKITTMQKENYIQFLNESQQMIKDKDDVPFIALALALNADGIWSDDTDFQEQKKFKVYTTKDMLGLL
ncbi:MAG: PIN domain-containing protein [Nanoarchaeota archaeon]